MHRLTQEQAMAKIKKVHGDLYSFSSFRYETARKHVTLVCQKHGEFSGRVNDFAKGSGCPACAVDRQKLLVSKSFSTFVSDASKKHGDRYKYDESSYVKYNHVIKILCKEHGWFEQMANTHVYGSGCPSCQQNGFSKDKNATVYLLSSGSGIVKIGITNRRLEERVREINKTSGKNFKVVNTFTCSGEYAYAVESFMLQALADYRYNGERFSGYTEAFSDDCFDTALNLFVAYKVMK